MSDDKQPGAAEPAAEPDRTGGAPAPGSTTPAAEDAKRQDKTKDKPDSGQNEDG